MAPPTVLSGAVRAGSDGETRAPLAGPADPASRTFGLSPWQLVSTARLPAGCVPARQWPASGLGLLQDLLNRAGQLFRLVGADAELPAILLSETSTALSPETLNIQPPSANPRTTDTIVRFPT